MAEQPVLGNTKPNDGQYEAYPGINDGARIGGDAMTDGIQGIQHSGASPSGGNEAQTSGVRSADPQQVPHILPGPTTGQTVARTASPGSVSPSASTPDDSELSDPGRSTFADPGLGVRQRDY
jgi:hypothetical protein